jgi:hypothetical protein
MVCYHYVNTSGLVICYMLISKTFKHIKLIVAIIVIAAIGTILLTVGHAAEPYASVTASAGTLTNGATSQTCSGASTADCVVFGSSQVTTTGYTKPPTKKANGQPDQWYWEISPKNPGVAGLPSITDTTYPAAGSANIWDTDMFQDSNVANAGVPTGSSPVVTALHAAGDYSICYIEAGAYQTGFPDDSNFAAADYGSGANQYGMQGWSGEWWYNIAGFANYTAGQPSSLTGAAPNIAAGLDQRIKDCKTEGQDGVEPDDLDGYTNSGDTGVKGAGWGLTQADSAGFERWLAYDTHSNGLAIFQKNDPPNSVADASTFDGMIIEECNFYDDPCAGSGGDVTPYLTAGKPVLNAEYTSDNETTAKFCSADESLGITGALYDLDLDGKTYQPCEN